MKYQKKIYLVYFIAPNYWPTELEGNGNEKILHTSQKWLVGWLEFMAYQPL